jgi:hypothetical protein
MVAKAILLVDDRTTLEDAKAHKSIDACLVVATTARGMAACEESSVSYSRLDSWCSVQEIADLGWRNYEALDGFCRVADEALLAANPDLARRHLYLMRFSYYFMKIAMDSLSIKVLMLARMLASERPELLIASGASSTPVAAKIPSFDDRTNLIGAILRNLPFARGIKIEWLAPRRGNGKKQSRYARLRNLAVRVAMWLHARRHMRHDENRKFILFNMGHDITDILPCLAKAGFEPLEWARRRATPRGPAIEWRRLLPAGVLAEVFSAAGCDYSELMEKYCLAAIGRQAPAAIAAHDAEARQIESTAPAFGLTGAINCDLSQRSAMAAIQNAGIPLVTYQEGAGYGSIVTPIYDYTEAREGDCFLAYGEGNAAYYAERNWPTKRFITVGSAYQDKTRARFSAAAAGSRRFTIMYVGTTVQPNIMHGPNNGLVDTYYFNSQLKIFDCLRRLTAGFDVVAKLHPADGASKELLATAPYRSIRIEDRPFDEVLDTADLFIIDFPSTTLLLGCHTQAYIWVLVEPGVTGLTDQQEEHLQRRARLFRSVESMAESLMRYAEGHVEELDRGGVSRYDQAYIQAYGMPRFDNGSAARAVAALSKLADARTA